MTTKNKGMYAPQNWEYIDDSRHWVRIFEDTFQSKAFIALSPEAKLLYIYLKREYKGVYNKLLNTVILPYTQIMELTGISKRKIRRKIEELIGLGFIRVNKLGGLYRETNHYMFIGDWKTLSDIEIAVIVKGLKEKRKKEPFDGKYIRSSTIDTTCCEIGYIDDSSVSSKSKDCLSFENISGST